jgi:hypothetical protein
MALTPTFHPTISYSGNIAARLIIKIVELLMDPEYSDYHRDLKMELESLQQTLTLAGLAIYAYEYTPLGRSLADIMNQEAERCCVVLKDLIPSMVIDRVSVQRLSATIGAKCGGAAVTWTNWFY